MAEEKAIKIIAKKLESTNVEELLFTIKQIRTTGEPELIPYLIELAANSKSDRVCEAIYSLLGDLKNKKCVPEIVKALENENYNAIHQKLLTSIWQSGLDYSTHIGLFVNMFAKRDFAVAFEAFTILDNLEEVNDLEGVDEQISFLKANITDFKGTQKEELFLELVHILEHLKS